MSWTASWVLQLKRLRKLGNSKNWFKAPGSPVERVPKHKLKHNANTRWDSMYDMMEHLIEFHLPVDYFLCLPNHRDLEKLKFSHWEWIMLRDFHVILDVNIIFWIEDHWDGKYIMRAKKIILDLPYTDCSSQMHQHHNRAPQESSAEAQPQLLEDFNAIAAQLHIKDMGSRKNPRDNPHAIEDKFRSYTNSTLMKQGDGPLKFWDVQ
ncbi:hypothetical protein OG21DRAFT_1527804 [Imleria badia]|nr:hypothetical protein OG21DRAFT_1527804 [Imleria badia]